MSQQLPPGQLLQYQAQQVQDYDARLRQLAQLPTLTFPPANAIHIGPHGKPAVVSRIERLIGAVNSTAGEPARASREWLEDVNGTLQLILRDVVDMLPEVTP